MTSKTDKVALRWTQHLKTEEQKERFLQALRNDTLVLGRLKDILEEDLESFNRKEVRSDSYDSPSWAFQQAHYNGVRQQLLALQDLLSFLK